MKTEKRRAIKKLYKAIDSLIAVQDLGLGNHNIQNALDGLNSFVHTLEREVAH